MTVTLGSVPFSLPTVITSPLSSITSNAAVCGGNIINDGGSPVITRGVVWDTLSSPTTSLNTKTTNGIGTGIYVSNLTGLQSGKTYNVRAYATNNLGTAYGANIVFSTTNTSFVNIPSVTIGTQVWNSKNLDVITYRNGDTIPQVTDPTQWSNLTTGAWCW